MLKSELFLSTATVEDNGTFACVAENKAGRDVGTFTLHVVVPMPPKPPQVMRLHSNRRWRNFDHIQVLL